MSLHESTDPAVGPSGAVDRLARAGRLSHETRIAPMSRGGLSLLAVAHDGAKLENLARVLRASVRVCELATAQSAH